MNIATKIAPGVITMDDVELLFEALPDADQVRFIAALLNRLHTQDGGADALSDALRVQAEDVAGFSDNDEYWRALAADEIYCPNIRDAGVRAKHLETQARRLDVILEHIQRRNIA